MCVVSDCAATLHAGAPGVGVLYVPPCCDAMCKAWIVPVFAYCAVGLNAGACWFASVFGCVPNMALPSTVYAL
jgi:hypothetical protein